MNPGISRRLQSRDSQHDWGTPRDVLVRLPFHTAGQRATRCLTLHTPARMQAYMVRLRLVTSSSVMIPLDQLGNARLVVGHSIPLLGFELAWLNLWNCLYIQFYRTVYFHLIVKGSADLVEIVKCAFASILLDGLISLNCPRIREFDIVWFERKLFHSFHFISWSKDQWIRFRLIWTKNVSFVSFHFMVKGSVDSTSFDLNENREKIRNTSGCRDADFECQSIVFWACDCPCWVRKHQPSDVNCPFWMWEHQPCDANCPFKLWEDQ